MSLFRVLTLSIFLSFSTFTSSFANNTIFYPMSIHTDGQYITAQQLFLRDDGAVWMYDVYGQIHLFDGQNIFTLGEKSKTLRPRDISYFDGKFWMIKENKIQSWSNKMGYNIEFELPIDSKQRSLHQSNGMFWGYDGDQFFSYEPEDKSFISADIVVSNTSSIINEIEITDAVQLQKGYLNLIRQQKCIPRYF